MLKDLLDQKKCFKLICGAGNGNLQEVERLVAVYAKAGCRFFDFAASEEVLQAAQRGLDFAVPDKNMQKDYHFCVSIGTKNDAHFKKARIDSEKCIGCGGCIEVCPQKAIRQTGNRKRETEIIENNCIGCLKCKSVCKHGAIEIYSRHAEHSEASVINGILRQKPQNDGQISCVELHVSDEEQATSMWDELCQNSYEMLSICIGRKDFSDGQIADLLKTLVAKRPPYSVIVQADGIPISGNKDDFETTLPTVETGEFIKSLNLPVYLLLSGGTNSKTAKLCKEKGLEVNGIAFGSYARKIVREYIERDDFFEGKCFDKAVDVAKILVNMG